MLFCERTSGSEEISARSGYAAVFRPGLRAYVVRSEGIRFDTALQPRFFEAIAPDAPTKLSILLGGHLVLHGNARGISLAPGDYQFHGRGWSERWEGPGFRVLVIEWDRDFGAAGDGGGGRLSPTDRAEVTRLADQLERRLPNELAACVFTTHLFARLRAIGLPLERLSATRLHAAMPAGVVPIAHAVTSVMRDLRRRPSWVDVEQPLERDARSLRRLTPGHAAWLAPLGWPTQWRRRLRALRLITAMRLLGSKNATVEMVAAASGYGSARALHLALHQESLPTPGSIRAFYRGQSI